MSVYTRNGDEGMTALFGGKQVLKCEELVDVYGSIDEINSWIGILVTMKESAKEKQLLESIQRDLFLIGSALAGWRGDMSSVNKRIDDMEKRIDMIEKFVPTLSHFILPGGAQGAAIAHVARSITRRVERQVVAFFHKKNSENTIPKEDQHTIISYINRLSDLLFMIARGINKDVGVQEVVWNQIPTNKKE